MQCKDIPTLPILEFLYKLKNRRYASWFNYESLIEKYPICKSLQENSVITVMPLLPTDKLALAKMRQLIKKGLVDGCTCGCKGNFEITEKGINKINLLKTKDNK